MPSRTRGDHSRALKSLFRRKPIATLQELRRGLRVKSRTTILGALRNAGYLSSYSHAGRYYTLNHIPTFDRRGLWFHGEVRFSKHGTLRRTVVVLVTEAIAGHTHEELAVVLGLRVHDTLRSLVETGEIGRVHIDVAYVYVAVDSTRASEQLSQREAMRAEEAVATQSRASATPLAAPSALDLARVIDVLVAVIHAPKDDAHTIAARLRAGGLVVTNEQVEAVFEQYELAVKKTARSRSRRSRH